MSLSANGDIDFSYQRVSEIDGIVGIFPGTAGEWTILDEVQEARDAREEIDVARVRVEESRTLLRFTFDMSTDVPDTVASSTNTYRIFLDVEGFGCEFGYTVTTSAPSSFGTCTPAPTNVFARRRARSVEILLSKVALNDRRSTDWFADAVAWATPGVFDQIAFDRHRPVRTTSAPEVDLSGGSETLSGNVYEVFHYPVLIKRQEFILSHTYRIVPADDDFAAFFTDFRIDELFNGGPATGAVNVPIRGIGPGFERPQAGNRFGSTRLQVAVSPTFLGNSRGAESPAAGYRNYAWMVWWIAHEIGHRWTSGLRFRHPVTGSIESLTEPGCNCHWNPRMHLPSAVSVAGRYADTLYPEHSPMGGRVLEEQSDGTFVERRSNGPVGFSAFDLYAMGLIGPSEVPPSFVLWDAQPAGANRLRGTKVPVRIEDIVAVEGTRDPAPADAQRTFTFGLYLLRRPERPVDPSILKRAEGLAESVVDYFRAATAGRMTLVP